MRSGSAAGSNQISGRANQPQPGSGAPKAASLRAEPADAKPDAAINEPGRGEGEDDTGIKTGTGPADPAALDLLASTSSQASPVAVMLEVMRFHHAIARHASGTVTSLADANLKTAADHFDRAHRAAKDVAPFLSPKARDVEPPDPRVDAVQKDGPPAMSELEIARRLAFVLELGARGLLKGDDRGRTKATERETADQLNE